MYSTASDVASYHSSVLAMSRLSRSSRSSHALGAKAGPGEARKFVNRQSNKSRRRLRTHSQASKSHSLLQTQLDLQFTTLAESAGEDDDSDEEIQSYTSGISQEDSSSYNSSAYGLSDHISQLSMESFGVGPRHRPSIGSLHFDQIYVHAQENNATVKISDPAPQPPPPPPKAVCENFDDDVSLLSATMSLDDRSYDDVSTSSVSASNGIRLAVATTSDFLRDQKKLSGNDGGLMSLWLPPSGGDVSELDSSLSSGSNGIVNLRMQIAQEMTRVALLNEEARKNETEREREWQPKNFESRTSQKKYSTTAKLWDYRPIETNDTMGQLNSPKAVVNSRRAGVLRGALLYSSAQLSSKDDGDPSDPPVLSPSHPIQCSQSVGDAAMPTPASASMDAYDDGNSILTDDRTYDDVSSTENSFVETTAIREVEPRSSGRGKEMENSSASLVIESAGGKSSTSYVPAPGQELADRQSLRVESGQASDNSSRNSDYETKRNISRVADAYVQVSNFACRCMLSLFVRCSVC